jgi:electron transport complex protein RnfC
MGLRSFFGILPPRIAYRTETLPVEALPLAQGITLLLAQADDAHLAARPGDLVKTGQDLAVKGKGPIVSPVTGRFLGLETYRGPDGAPGASLSIAAESKDLFDPGIRPVEDFSKLDPPELRTWIQRLGFPNFAAVVPDPAAWRPVPCVLVSAMDRDPLGTANQQAFRDHSERLDPCIRLLSRATEARECVVAVPRHLAAIAPRPSLPGVRTVYVPAVYPNGLPEILAARHGAGALLRSDRGGIMGNTLVVGFEHALAMLDALENGKPLMEKIVTFSSGADGTPKNFRVRIGTPASLVLEKSGVKLETGGKLIMDGVLRGHACYSDEQPITAMTESLHVQSASAVFHFQNQACMNCGRCSAICPVDLQANLIARCSEYGLFERCRQLVAENCIECGLCAYVCPAHRPLVQLIVHAKKVIETQVVEDLGLVPPVGCEACGPTCPAIKLFDFGEGPREGRN